MLLHLLAVGDVVGQGGLDFLERHLRTLKKLHNVDFTVVNGENASGVGLTPKQAQAILDAGADVITLGNHTWNRLQIKDFLEESPYILRPANYPKSLPGRGYGVFDGPRGLRIGVMNLIGRLELPPHNESPFLTADGILKGTDADIVVVDFHAEATSEKGAMGYYLDGRVSALWGTHTHVPTADETVFPKGTGYLTDLGMTGVIESVLGIEPWQSVEGFLGGLPGRYKCPEGPCKMQGAIFTLGLLCGAVGRLWSTEDPCREPEVLLSECAGLARAALEADFAALGDGDVPRTAGERLYLSRGLTGIRGEAARGLPTVRDAALPALRRALHTGRSRNNAGAIALLHLIAATEDTNMIARGGMEAAQAARAACAAVLERDPLPPVEVIEQLDRDFIRQNLSPGGCADLLAAAFFLLSWQEED